MTDISGYLEAYSLNFGGPWLFLLVVVVNIFTTVHLLQVSRGFWIESLNEVKPVTKGVLKPDREVKLRFVDR